MAAAPPILGHRPAWNVSNRPSGHHAIGCVRSFPPTGRSTADRCRGRAEHGLHVRCRARSSDENEHGFMTLATQRPEQSLRTSAAAASCPDAASHRFGCRAASGGRSNASAGPSGIRRPCAQLRSVATLTRIISAKLHWRLPQVAPNRLHIRGLEYRRAVHAASGSRPDSLLRELSGVKARAAADGGKR